MRRARASRMRGMSAALLLAGALSAWAPAGAQTPARDFAGSLVAVAPDSALARTLAPFAQLVGSWDVRVAYYAADRPPETLPGEWHFAWVLGGRAVQDVFRVPAPPGTGVAGWRGLGTTIRVWDQELGAWRSTWISALNGSVTEFIGRQAAGELQLEPREPPDDERFRWVFFDVRPGSFRWRAESSVDDGSTWRVEQEMWATRREGLR